MQSVGKVVTGGVAPLPAIEVLQSSTLSVEEGSGRLSASELGVQASSKWSSADPRPRLGLHQLAPNSSPKALLEPYETRTFSAKSP